VDVTKGTVLGERIRSAREAKKLSTMEVAAKLPITESTLSQIERGEIIRPPDNVLSAIASAVGLSLGGLKSTAEADKDKGRDIAPHKKMMQFAKIDTEERRVWGWAYQSHDAEGNQIVDFSGDIVDDTEAVAALEKAFHNYVRDSREADDGHETFGVGHLIEGSFMSPEKARLMGIPDAVPTGIFAGFEFDDDGPGRAAWEKVKKRESRMMSIFGSKEPQ